MAKDPAALYASLPRGQWIVLTVVALDAAGVARWDKIRIATLVAARPARRG